MISNSIIAVDILPHHDGKVVMYGAPNKDITHLVSGKLRIILSRPQNMKLITIRLKGKSEYSDWEDQYSALEIIKLEQILHEKNTLPRGVTDIDYEFRVPGNLPQTYRTNFGVIFYKLVAVVQPASLMSKYTRVERGINFLRHYLPCRRELLPAPPQKIYKGERKDIINFELELPTVIYVNEKSLLIRLKLCPKSDQGRIKKIHFELVQSEKYSVKPSRKDMDEFSVDPANLVSIVPLNGSPLTKRKRTYPIAPTTLNVSNEVDNWNNALIYNLPFAQYSRGTRKSRLKATLKSPLMKVRHKFRFVLMFEDENENDLELVFPISITTIPEEKNSLFADLFADTNLPSYDDTFMEITNSEITNVDESGPMLVPDKPKPPPPPKLKQKKSLSFIGRLLHRNENNSHKKDSSTSTSDPSSASSSRRELLFEESPDTSLTSIEHVNASCYLNMPDEDDLDRSSAFEIRSEPNSPKLSGIPGTFVALNDLSSNAISKSHRRSVSLDSSVVVESSSTLNSIGLSKTHHRPSIKQKSTKPN
ncbi:35501_t:CDS:2 [Racocetra persica]|uniref:35501_t:CDS:1 n=1 Tax=Racocetra persica TaxID=160502 RepID=A0ACA9QEL4_9GLOM|nr:35501_t:CDS:2 [Racocetra persica]